jgi:hypothetical protein
MSIIRLILLVVVLGGLTLLLVQNLSPALPLVFLGMRTKPLPLSLWILFSVGSGGLTSLLISSLFKFTNYFSSQPSTGTFKSTTTTSRVPKPSRDETIPPSGSSREPVSKTTYTSNDDFDDWETDDSQADNWDFDEQRQTRKSPASPERQSDSVYSYSSQAPQNTGVGKTESVYDADYRVIIPPYQPDTTNQSDDDDWNFLEDDDFEDDQENPRR